MFLFENSGYPIRCKSSPLLDICFAAQSEPCEKKEQEVNGKEASVKQGSAVKEQSEPSTRNEPEMHVTEQKEVRMKSGKRRIQPIFVASLTAPEEDSPTAEANYSPR